MSRLTKTGLWLLPWGPGTGAVLSLTLKFFPSLDPCPLELAWRSIPTTCRILTLILQASGLVFVTGVILLIVSGVRRLVRRPRQEE